MPRLTIRKCRDCGGLHQTDEWPSECFGQFARQRSDLPMPAIRSDGMGTILNHADGRLYDSKSAYYRAVKDAGCEIIGNEKLPERQVKEPDVKDIARDVKTAIQQVEARL
jgi:hypothetical protein